MWGCQFRGQCICGNASGVTQDAIDAVTTWAPTNSALMHSIRWRLDVMGQAGLARILRTWDVLQIGILQESCRCRLREGGGVHRSARVLELRRGMIICEGVEGAMTSV